MFWSAAYDPRANKAIAWTCRKGGSMKDKCHFADGLTKDTIEKAVGVQLWPGASNVGTVQQ